MAYSNATIVKVIGNLNNAINYYSRKSEDEIKICISCGNKKIGRVKNVSLAPIITCTNCKECKHFCYDIKAVLLYGNVLDARARNTVLALQHPEKYFGKIRKSLNKHCKHKFFRWHVSGDIPSMEYFEEMIAIAKENPDWLFWTYTKNYYLVNAYVKAHGNSKENAIPENLIIMFSEWDGLEMVNPYQFPIFSCKLKDGNKNRTEKSFEQMYKCPGNCDVCKEIHRGCIKGEDTYADEH